jgi:hypothetical protein
MMIKVHFNKTGTRLGFCPFYIDNYSVCSVEDNTRDFGEPPAYCDADKCPLLKERITVLSCND